MTKTFVTSDHHFNHGNILRFKRDDGVTPVRDFPSVGAMNEFMVQQWNDIVAPDDKVYHLGDFSMGRNGLSYAARLNGRKTLVAGNHDYANASEYLEHFDNVVGCVVGKGKKYIMTHLPIKKTIVGHEAKGGYGYGCNIHGHMHQRSVGDPWYKNVSVERTNYAPVLLQDVLEEGWVDSL